MGHTTAKFVGTLLLLGVATSASSQSRDKGDASARGDALPVVTIADMGRPQTVIDGVCSAGMYPPITVMDGFAQTLNNATKSLQATARKQGADAVVGMTVSWETPNSVGAKGRVLICGTLVKFK